MVGDVGQRGLGATGEAGIEPVRRRAFAGEPGRRNLGVKSPQPSPDRGASPRRRTLKARTDEGLRTVGQQHKEVGVARRFEIREVKIDHSAPALSDGGRKCVRTAPPRGQAQRLHKLGVVADERSQLHGEAAQLARGIAQRAQYMRSVTRAVAGLQRHRALIEAAPLEGGENFAPPRPRPGGGGRRSAVVSHVRHAAGMRTLGQRRQKLIHRHPSPLPSGDPAQRPSGDHLKQLTRAKSRC